MTAIELQDNTGVMIDSLGQVGLVLLTNPTRPMVEAEPITVGEHALQIDQPSPEYCHTYVSLAYDVAQAVHGYLQKKKSHVQLLE